MTHAKSPIEQAVEALEVEAGKRCSYCRDGREVRDRNGGKWHWVARAGDAGDHEPCNAAQIRIAIDIVRATDKSLRASTGKMTAAEYWYQRAPGYGTTPSDYKDFIELIQENALAAAQPEPRPLRELIAEGCEHFWIKAHGFDEYSLAALIEDAIWINDDDVMACYTKEHFGDCDALPIPKPTGAP